MHTPRRLFLSLSTAILVAVVAFVLINNRAARESLEQSLDERAQEIVSAYELVKTSSLTSAAQMASFVAADVEIKRYMADAHAARVVDGDGASGEKASTVRYDWLRWVQPRLGDLQQRFGMNELKFHLAHGGQAITFLRVYRPERFGDRVQGAYHPVNLSLATGRPTRAVVLDSGGAALRAVEPVTLPDPQTDRELLVGFVEVGLSFDSLLELLAQHLGVQMAVLLDQVAATSVVDEVVRERELMSLPGTQCELASAVGPDVMELLDAMGSEVTAQPQDGVTVMASHGRRLARISAPLEFVGPATAAGNVVIWFDAEAALAAYEHTVVRNIASAIGGFVVLELILLLLLRGGIRVFESELHRRTVEVRQLNRRLTRIATTDGLTGLFNRRHFLQRMQVELDRAQRSGGHLTLLLIDLDYFKDVNDTHGHKTGDEVLQQVGRFLLNHIRSVDLAGRYGGEELCVLLPDTDAGQGRAIAERMRREIAALRFTGPQGEVFGITASLGVAQWDGVSDRDTLFVQADNALYDAKDRGRDCVSLFGEMGGQ